jgi:hypothetical protein
MNDNSLIAFKAITNFVSELSSNYGGSQHSLRLYHRLLNKTMISHDQIILKHISNFREFCVNNASEIVQKSVDLKQPIIKYSDRVFIDMKAIFMVSKKDDLDVIWRHILTISALLDPGHGAKAVLISDTETKQELGTGKEGDFLSNIMSQISEHAGPNATPESAIGSIMSSGMLPKLMADMQSGMSSGQLDMSKIMGSVQSLLSGLSTDGSDPGVSMLTNMLGTLSAGMGSSTTPDIASLMAGAQTAMAQSAMAQSVQNANTQSAISVSSITISEEKQI